MRRPRAAAVYRCLLWLAPARLRARHGTEMEEAFLDALARARSRGRLAWLAAWLCASIDLACARAAGLLARRRAAPRRQGRTTMMLTSDVRHAWRSLAGQKLSTALAAGMLGLGMAASVAVFSLANGLFLRPFAFPEPGRLVYINETAPKWNLELTSVNFADFVRWREGARTFEAMGLYDYESFTLSSSDQAEQVRGLEVTHDFARALGIRPVVGRTFTQEEDRPNGPLVVMIGHGLWRERFGARNGVVGETLRVDGVARTIVGVLPPEADFPAEVRLWVPLAEDASETGSYSYEGVGRLKPGVSIEQARQDLLRAHQPIWQERDSDRAVSPVVRPLRQEFVRDFTTAASAVSMAVALLLVVACANVAAVMLARALARRREMGIRLALGASRFHLLRQLLVENLLLAAIGGLLGLALGQWAQGVLVASLPDVMPGWVSFRLDGRVMGFAAMSVVATAVLFGWIPALHAVRGDLRSAIHATSPASTASVRGRRTLALLVAAEFALAALLLVSGGLLARAFDRVRAVDPGFATERLLTFSVSLPEAKYPQREHRLAFWERLQPALAALPGVESAGLVNCAPMTGCHWGWFFEAEGRPPRAKGEANPVVLVRAANADYFQALGSRLRAGRLFDEHDGRPDQPGVVIVNDTFARTFWPEGTSPVGRRIKNPGTDNPWLTVVGVVADVKHYGLERPMRPGAYRPLPEVTPGNMTVLLRTKAEPAMAVPLARAALRELDAELPMIQVRTMDEWLQRSLRIRRAYSWMLGVFAVVTLLLAVGGAYGVAMYLVSQRTRELGIRVALGARHGDIVRTVVGRGLAVVGLGVAIGVAGSFGASRLMSALLFGVSPMDGPVIAGAVVVLLLTAVCAHVLPARRASRLDPMRVLRIE